MNVDRFWSKVMVAGDCWLWTGRTSDKGYGRFWVPPRELMAHRVAYELEVGPIPEGLTLDHLCRVRNCVNPAHLEPVTAGENVLRGEGPTARHARQTHCKHGHEFTEENTLIEPHGARSCRACSRRRSAAHWRRKRPSLIANGENE